MKKLKYLILLLLLLPITVLAKTPNKQETIKVIKSIENIQVDDNVIIYNVEIDNNKITLNINDNGVDAKKTLNYEFKDNELVFTGGTYTVNPETKEINKVESNDYAFYLYSILESKSSMPYDINNYYNESNIQKKIKELNEETKTYKEDTNTFAITLSKEYIGSSEYINIKYHYYFDGDYPVMLKEISQEEFTNPNTGNYSIYVTIVLILVIGIGIYTCIDKKEKE